MIGEGEGLGVPAGDREGLTVREGDRDAGAVGTGPRPSHGNIPEPIKNVMLTSAPGASGIPCHDTANERSAGPNADGEFVDHLCSPASPVPAQ
jgi:hypothetical protein